MSKPELVALKSDAAGRPYAEVRIVGWESDPVGRMFGDPGHSRHYLLGHLDERDQEFIEAQYPSRQEECQFLEGVGPCVLIWDDQRPEWWPE